MSKKQKLNTASEQEGFYFPTKPLRRQMYEILNDDKIIVTKTAMVYAAAVLEYLTLECLELAHQAMSSSSGVAESYCLIIYPQHLKVVLKCDKELQTLYCGPPIRASRPKSTLFTIVEGDEDITDLVDNDEKQNIETDG